MLPESTAVMYLVCFMSTADLELDLQTVCCKGQGFTHDVLCSLGGVGPKLFQVPSCILRLKYLRMFYVRCLIVWSGS